MELEALSYPERAEICERADRHLSGIQTGSER